MSKKIYLVISLVHIGEEFRKLSDLIGFCEVAVESTLQVALQIVVLSVVFTGRRIPSPAIYRSIATSITMIMFAVTKALMSQQISHDKKKSKLKQIKQLVWIVCLNIIIFTTNSVQWTSFIYTFITYGKEYNHKSPSDQKMFLIINIIQITLTVAMCIFMFKNFFKHKMLKTIFLYMFNIKG